MLSKRRARGFILLPAVWFWLAFGATVIEFGAMIYDRATQCSDCGFRGRGDGGSF